MMAVLLHGGQTFLELAQLSGITCLKLANFSDVIHRPTIYSTAFNICLITCMYFL